MGYCIYQNETNFFIPKEYFGLALAAIKDFMVQKSEGDTIRWFSWINTEGVMDCQTLEDALHAWRWVAEFNENGDIWHLYFRGDKSGHDLDFFKVLAPFVRDESYIIMRGEDGEMWRWFFKDKTCIEQNAIITWK